MIYLFGSERFNPYLVKYTPWKITQTYFSGKGHWMCIEINDRPEKNAVQNRTAISVK